ncbi:MAG: DUF2784 domain-containing protein [Desulfobacterales bacterium]|jgi:hypothetical protein|nr:DUF2784 domain-containing protein [Desulfobacterales bacterium]
MPYHLLADLVVIIHLTFVLFSVAGALLVIGWRKIFYLHLPAAVWAAWIEFSGKICPLTPLEKWLRIKGGDAGYSGDFVGHYILSILYPSGLTREVQFILGGVVVGLNIIIYGYILFPRKGRGGKS